MSLSRKGEVEIEFNWIMVIVAGSLILMFFFGIVTWAKKGSEQGNSVRMANYLDSLLTGASVTKQSVNTLDFPFEEIRVSCDNFQIDKSQRPVRNKILFSPLRIEKGDLVTFSYDWNAPFRVVNFLYLSSPQIRYIFYGDESDDTFKFLRENFPSQLSPEFNPSYISNDNSYNVRFVYVNPSSFDPAPGYLGQFKDMAASDVSAVAVYGEHDGAFAVNFFRKTNPGVLPVSYAGMTSSRGFGEASLFGAIFTDAENFDCAMTKTMSRLEKIKKTYALRSSELSAYYQTDDPLCEQLHSNAVAMLNQVTTIGTLPLFTQQMQTVNSNLQKNSCAMVY